MRRIKSENTKILIIYISISLTICILGIRYILKIIRNHSSYGEDIYSKSLDYSIYDIDIYNVEIKNKLIIFAIIFFIFIVMSNLIFFNILKRLHYKKSMKIIDNLENIEGNIDVLNIDPVMNRVYREMKEKFNSNIEDYKRLNSYLSHEQKNAMSILRTSLELEENKNLLGIINKVSNTVEDVLAISDIRNENEMYKIDVVLVCAQICDQYSLVYNNIIFDFDEDSNTNILGKEKWIHRAISNILDNAIKYGEGGEIRVNVKNEKGSVIISIQDNGIGISKSNMKRIFNDRYRINELNKDGYGIGLSLVKHVCNLCDGFIWVESDENKGSIFYLAFKECR